MSKTLEITSLTKKYGSKKAVDGVTLSLDSGEIFAMVGPNGSGKTTLIKMLVGLLDPDAGKIEILGFQQPKEANLIAQGMGYIPDDPTAYQELSGREFLWLVAKLRGIGTKDAKEMIDKLLSIFPLGDQADQLASGYSRGTKQKFAFLAAVMNNPKLLIIDEPVAGLDPASADIFKEQLKKMAASGTTIFFVTHILSFATQVSDRVGFLVNGQLKAVKKNKHGLKLRSAYQSIVGA